MSEQAAWQDEPPRRRDGSVVPQLMTLAEVARALQVSEKTVRRLLGRGFPHVRFGRVLRFDPADVQRWVEARRR